MSSNPKNPSGNWNDKDKISLNEIPLIGPLRDRVGLIFVFRTNHEMGYVADYAFKKAKIINNIGEVNKQEEKNYDFLRKYILYCKRFDPALSKEAELMIAQYYVSIMTKPESHESPRLYDTLTSLCYAVARLKQKDIIDIEDVKDVIEFYNLQLHHLSQLVAIPRDLRELAFEEIINTLKDSAFKHEFIELVRTVCRTNVFVREYISEDLHVRTNRKLRDIQDRFVKFGDDRIVILSYSPLILAWKNTYKGVDMDIPSRHPDGDRRNTEQDESSEKVSESDTSDTSDSEKKGVNQEVASNKAKIPSVTTDKEIKSDVTDVTHVTPTQRDTANFSRASDTINAEGTVMDIEGLLSEKERERCKQTSLTYEQINTFYRVFNELENVSNLHPGSFSSDDKGTIYREELRSRLVSVGKLTANDADWIIKEMRRIGNIKEVMFDTFRRVS